MPKDCFSRKTHTECGDTTELTKDEAGAHLLYFLLGPAGNKHHSRGRNTYPKGGNKLGLQCSDCHGTSPKQRTAAKRSLCGHFPYCCWGIPPVPLRPQPAVPACRDAPAAGDGASSLLETAAWEMISKASGTMKQNCASPLTFIFFQSSGFISFVLESCSVLTGGGTVLMCLHAKYAEGIPTVKKNELRRGQRSTHMYS